MVLTLKDSAAADERHAGGRWPLSPVTLTMPRMKHLLLATLIWIVSSAAPLLAAGFDDFYKLGPDSMAQDGVPQGKIVGPTALPSEVFPGTQHTYWVYVPAQYDASVPAS